MYIASLKVLTLKSEDNQTELMYSLQKVRRSGEQIKKHPDNLLYHMRETAGSHCVGCGLWHHDANKFRALTKLETTRILQQTR